MAVSQSQPPVDSKRRVPTVREPLVQVDDLIDGLRWPLIFRSARTAVRAGSLGLAVVLIVALSLLDRVPSLWREGEGPISAAMGQLGTGLGRALLGVLSLDASSVGIGASNLVALPAKLLQDHSWGLLILIPALGLVAVLGGAMSRMAAVELARRQSSPWPSALGFALARWTSLVGVVLGPAALVGGLALLLCLAGAVFLGVPYLNVLGGLGYGLLLALGTVAVLVGAGFALGAPMLIPAVAVEGADAVDSMGRTFPYTLSRPVRLAAYLLLMTLVVWVGSGVAQWAASAVSHFTAEAATGWAGPTAREGVEIALGKKAATKTDGTPVLTGSWSAAGPLIGFWNRALFTLASAVGVSMFFAASTAVYLLMRFVVDGQDPAEIWVPGEIEETLARTQASRQQALPVPAAGVPQTDAPPASDE